MSDAPQPSLPAEPPRRSFFKWLTFGLGGLATLALGIPLVGYFFGALRKSHEVWVDLGAVSEFPPGQTRLKTFDNPRPLSQPWDGMTAHIGVYVRNLGSDGFVVFAMNCTHLGCPVSWFPQSGLFMCPCHGGVYYENGEHASGPPPRGLYHCDVRVEHGHVKVRAPHLPTLQNTLDRPA